jgi:hypothetical protein
MKIEVDDGKERKKYFYRGKSEYECEDRKDE